MKKSAKRKIDKDQFRVWTEHGTTYVRMPIVAFIGGVFAIALLLIMFWSVKRKPNVQFQLRDGRPIAELMPALVGLTQSSLDGGNRIEILQNGDGFFPSLFRDIAAARESVHLETFIWNEGPLARTLAAALAAKARSGVEVRVLVDDSGGHQLRGDTEKVLESAGAKVEHFHPVRFRNLGLVNNRDHRKLVIIDGRIAYIGGHGIADEWTGHAQDKKHFRDTALRVSGPVVNRLQGAFSENWIEETGEILGSAKYFPHLQPVGPTSAHVAYTSPSGSVSSVKILYYLAIQAARHEIIIQNPYLLPDSEAIRALETAARRGVQVKIMVPSDTASDSAIVQHASHHHFGTLLKRGVRIWEYDHTLLHQKVMIVDGIWSAVGSTNFDDRSLKLNDEVNIGILDPNVAAQLRAAFAADLAYAKERTLKEWENRSLWHKLIDAMAYQGRSQL
jgi:cardiolipin synthase